jgi:hypothetical protein
LKAYRIIAAALVVAAMAAFTASSASATTMYPFGDTAASSGGLLLHIAFSFGGPSETCTMNLGGFKVGSSGNGGFATYVTDPVFTNCSNPTMGTPTASGAWTIQANYQNSTTGATISVPREGLSFPSSAYCTNYQSFTFAGASPWYNGFTSPINVPSTFDLSGPAGTIGYDGACYGESATLVSFSVTGFFAGITDATHPSAPLVIGPG